MHKLLTAVLLVVLVLAAVEVGATCPNMSGVFSTTNGTCQAGRVSEAWVAGGPGRPGNVENAMSWDGAVLGAQWRAWGMTINSTGAVETGRRVLGPYMYIDYQTDYDGGQFWLSRNFPWSDGTGDLTGNFTAYHVTTTVTFYNGLPVAQSSNVAMTGVFTNCPELQGCVLEWAIANAVKVWDSSSGAPLPADYPPLLGANAGELFNACCMQMSISCVVGNTDSSWGAIKGLYR